MRIIINKVLDNYHSLAYTNQWKGNENHSQ